MAKHNYNAERTNILRLLSSCRIDAKQAEELLAAIEHKEELR